MATQQVASFAGVELALKGDQETVNAWLRKPAIAQAVDAVRSWVESRRPPLKAARALVEAEPEDPGFRELIIELVLDTDFDTSQELWDEASQCVHTAAEAMTSHDRKVLDAGFSLQVISTDLAWDD